jgi:hypothetical protein
MDLVCNTLYLVVGVGTWMYREEHRRSLPGFLAICVAFEDCFLWSFFWLRIVWLWWLKGFP